jgi:hypothetical protein
MVASCQREGGAAGPRFFFFHVLAGSAGKNMEEERVRGGAMPLHTFPVGGYASSI